MSDPVPLLPETIEQAIGEYEEASEMWGSTNDLRCLDRQEATLGALRSAIIAAIQAERADARRRALEEARSYLLVRHEESAYLYLADLLSMSPKERAHYKFMVERMANEKRDD